MIGTGNGNFLETALQETRCTFGELEFEKTTGLLRLLLCYQLTQNLENLINLSNFIFHIHTKCDAKYLYTFAFIVHISESIEVFKY